VIFILFGIIGLYDSIPERFLTPPVMAGGIFFILVLVGLVVWRNRRREVMVKENDAGAAVLSPERKV